MEILNETPFPVGLLGGRLYFPGHSLTVVVKGTFDLLPDGTVEAAEEQLHPTGDEEFEGEDDRPVSLRYASDFAYFKPRADLLLVGRARAPGGDPVRRLPVTFQVGEREKRLQVAGDRWWSGDSVRPEATEPRPFTAMDLRYENAFGGRGYPSNPTGKGYTRVWSEAGYEVLPLPNVEDPGATMDAPDDVVPPAGFGPLHPAWELRASKAGSYGGAWADERWPWFPEDFDWSYFNAAPPDMQVEGYLNGDEELFLGNLDPELPRLRTRLPGRRLRCFLHEIEGGGGAAARPEEDDADLRGGEPPEEEDSGRFREIPLRLDTLWVDAEERTVALVWRGHTEVKTEEFEEVEYLYVLSEALDEKPASQEEIRIRFDRLRREYEGEIESPPKVEEPDEPVVAASDPEEEVAAAVEEMNASLTAAGVEPVDPDAPPPEQSPEARHRSEEMLAEYGIDDLEEEGADGALTRSDVVALVDDGESLSGRDLSEPDLSELDLTGADLSGAVLDGADLRRAVLDDADLSGATLEGADLSGASLRGCDLTEADLAGANLVEADLAGAELEDAILEGADLEGSALEGARGANAILPGADLGAVRAARSAFPAADFTGAVMREADFREAELREACLEGADATAIDLSRARLEALQAGEGADLTRAVVVEAEAAGSIWSESVLVEADFRYADLEGVEFSGADLTGANLSAAEMTGGRLAKADLTRARLIRCNLFEASLEKAVLEEADLRGSNLYGAEVRDARLNGARLDGANLKMTKLARS